MGKDKRTAMKKLLAPYQEHLFSPQQEACIYVLSQIMPPNDVMKKFRELYPSCKRTPTQLRETTYRIRIRKPEEADAALYALARQQSWWEHQYSRPLSQETSMQEPSVQEPSIQEPSAQESSTHEPSVQEQSANATMPVTSKDSKSSTKEKRTAVKKLLAPCKTHIFTPQDACLYTLSHVWLDSHNLLKKYREFYPSCTYADSTLRSAAYKFRKTDGEDADVLEALARQQSWWEQRNSEPLSHEPSPNELRIQRQAEARARYRAHPATQQKRQEKNEKERIKEREKREREKRRKAHMASNTSTVGAASSHTVMIKEEEKEEEEKEEEEKDEDNKEEDDGNEE